MASAMQQPQAKDPLNQPDAKDTEAPQPQLQRTAATA